MSEIEAGDRVRFRATWADLTGDTLPREFIGTVRAVREEYIILRAEAFGEHDLYIYPESVELVA